MEAAPILMLTLGAIALLVAFSALFVQYTGRKWIVRWQISKMKRPQVIWWANASNPHTRCVANIVAVGYSTVRLQWIEGMDHADSAEYYLFYLPPQWTWLTKIYAILKNGMYTIEEAKTPDE